MKPEQFIREFGVEKAREVVEGAPDGFTHIDIYEGIKYFVYCKGESHEDDQNTIAFNPRTKKEIKGGFVQNGMNKFGGWFIRIADLKRLVESLDLVNCFDDLEQAKSWVSDMDEDFPYVFKGDTYDNRFYKHELVTAIADHESIYGGGDE